MLTAGTSSRAVDCSFLYHKPSPKTFGTLKRCFLPKTWIPGFTLWGRWDTVSRLLTSLLWSKWPIVAVGSFYSGQFECRGTLMGSWGLLSGPSPATITSCCSVVMHGLVLQQSAHASRKCVQGVVTRSSCMASRLTGHVNHRACLGRSGWRYTTAASSSCQHPATSNSHWGGVNIPQAAIKIPIDSMLKR